MNVRQATPLALLTLAAVASFYLVTRDDDAGSNDAATLRAGYYLTGVTLRGTDASGAIEYELRAERAEHDPTDDSITLSALALDYGDGDAPWTVHAAQGFMPDVDASLVLSGGVAITRPAVSAQHITEIITDSLLIELATRLATTDDDVTVAVGPNRLAGTGLKVDMQNEQIEILSNVTGRFEPRETP